MLHFRQNIFYRFLCILFLVCCLLIASISSGYSYNPSDVVLGINSSNIGYLRYFNIQNIFDSVSVNFLFGEVRINNGSIKSFIPLITRTNEEIILKGTYVQGVDSLLLTRTKTNIFRYKPNSYIMFLRKLSLIWNNSQQSESSKHDAVDEEYYDPDIKWLSGEKFIKDRTEFIMELVKVWDPNIVYVIDSVGVDKSDEQIVADRYGWKPDRKNHVRKLPNDFANQDVFIRIKPVRYGRPDKALELKIIPDWISKSSFSESDRPKASDLNLVQKLLNKFFKEALFYCDSVKTATGRLPEKLPLIDALTHEQKEILEKMFFDVKITNKDTIITEKNNQQIKSPDVYLSDDRHKKLSVSHINCIPFDKSFSLNIHCKVGLPESTIKLFDYQYTLIKEIWHGDLHSGNNTISFDNLDLPRGVYLLQIYHNPMNTTISAIIKR